ncbi:MAG: T-RNA-binding domain protein [Candidatus Woesebacteria bacterium GW2011_GWB1_39_12]|uniref:T-RNA-binding domain protein n=2 Tax=Candidatus Woeseibacteriota TaxID=1752722 RepID=A0A0G0M201_9BACT|nr:MAG: T-RNA-binding domain protein [Candidatus Woesebacteria bacterium GW2011_GWA1_39_12]KKR00292.1 MAG: T-RNA-binding domain protein [Candidatus Woesebacteria bacterium GW2011_GWB1_39_12]
MSVVKIDDFQKMDIRIGTVVKAEVPKWSHWVIRLIVDFGSEIGERAIFAGMMKFYKPEDLESKQFPFIVNLEPKKIGPEGDYSQGMMLAADLILDPEKLDEGKPVLFQLQEKVPNGTKVR